MPVLGVSMTPERPANLLSLRINLKVRVPISPSPMCQCLSTLLPRPAFERLIKNYPDLAMNMLAILSHRLKYFSRLIEDLSLKEVPQRLAAYLLYLGDSRNNVSSVDLNISKGQLASLLGTIPETLSRILNRMAAQGFITVRGREIGLLRRDALESLASGEKALT